MKWSLIMTLVLVCILVELTLLRGIVREAVAVYMRSTITICLADPSSSDEVTCEVGMLSRERFIVPKNTTSM